MILVTGVPAVGKTAFVRSLGVPFVDADGWAMRRFGLPKTEASRAFHENLEDVFPEFAEFVCDSGAVAVADCAVTPCYRARYREAFGPMGVVWLEASLPAVLARNAMRPDPVPRSAVVEKFFARRFPAKEEGFMPTYLKKMEDGTVLAMGDERSLAMHGGTCDAVVSDETWRANDCIARLGPDGAIVLGFTAEERRANDALRVRAVRDMKLKRCDHVSPMRWLAMTDEERTAWAEYRQALLDVPQTEGFPWDGVNVPWPTKPE